ncbi:TRP-like ion channel Pkd2 [Bulinus truncatus]|nr:TRP-like ion channel Pkd2 [Bulinus truncatus]
MQVYQDAIDLKTAPFVGNIATYKGGGYVILTKRTYGRTVSILEKAKSENWIDLNTKAIFLEYTIYNPNVNLFTSVTAVIEFLQTGTAVFRLISYIGGFGVIVLVFEIFFGIVTIVFFVQCIKKVRLQRLTYFTDFWNILEFVLLCLAVACIVLYAFKHILTDVALSALQNRKSDGFVNFNTIALYDELYGFVMAAVVFMATIQFLRLLQFNKKMGMLGSTIKLASKDLSVFSITFFLYFFAFTATGYLLFSNQLTSYQNVVSTAEAMFAFALGSFDFNELSSAQPFWGPLFVFSYIGVVYIGLMSIFLTIIGEAFTQVKENVALQSNDYEIVDFIWKKIKSLF